MSWPCVTILNNHTYRPNMAYINTINYEQADENLRQTYDQIMGTRGKLAAVHQIQSLHPGALLAHMDLYKQVMFAKSPLKRYQREMIAVIVSAANDCPYCIRHHEEALLFYWKDEERVSKLSTIPTEAGLSEEELALCLFAKKLTQQPGQSTQEDIIKLQEMGWEDRAILDATQVVAYFNFVNRMVLALGVTFTEEEAKGYNY